MRPGAFAGIDTVATIHPVSSMLIASMRPGANRRDHYPKIQRVCHLLTSFNEARARIAGITGRSPEDLPSAWNRFNEARRESPGSRRNGLRTAAACFLTLQ